MIEQAGQFSVSPTIRVSTRLLHPDHARAILLLAHGAGAGMRHVFLEDLAQRLAHRGIATLRYQFPYMERGSGRPDPPALLLATVRAAVVEVARVAPDLPVFAGGKSMGGRMTSLAGAGGMLAASRGLVFFGYPLHPPGKPTAAALAARSEHLPRVTVPMLFLQGTRDKLAEIERMRDLCGRLAPRADLAVVDDADHSFHVPKRSGRTDAEVLQGLAETAAAWMVEKI